MQFLHKLAAGHGEVSEATIQGYLRAASQIEDIWKQIDEQVDELIGQGQPPWDAYARMGYALAFVSACRMNVVFVQELIKGASADASTAGSGSLPRVTYDQALALCACFEPYLEEAIKATSPHYRPGALRIPLELGPRVSYGDQYPLPHIIGLLSAGRETREWAAGLLAKYELAVGSAKLPVPQAITTHLEQMHSTLQLGDFHLQTGANLFGQITQGQPVPEQLGAEGEKMLWEAMQCFYLISQLVARPGALAQPASSGPGAQSQTQRSAAPPAQPTHLHAPVPPPPDVSKVLGQLQLRATQGTPAPAAPDLLSQLQLTNPPEAPTHPAPAVPDLLSQLQAPAPPPRQGQMPRKPRPDQATSEDSVAKLLSDLTGEEQGT